MTEGMPARRSIRGLTTPLTLGEAYSDRYMALRMLTGHANAIAVAVTITVPTMKG